MARTYAARDAGYQFVHYLRKDFSYLNTGQTLVVGTVPAGSQILNLNSGVYTRIAFTAGTNKQIDIGIAGDTDLYGTDISLATVAFVALDEAASATGVNAWYCANDTTILATLDLTGSTNTAGTGSVVIAFLPKDG